MFTNEEIRDRIIPYRLQALDAANKAAELRQSWDTAKTMKIYFDEKLTITGNSNAYTNPVLESGLIHCRALLDFLGLKIEPKNSTKLVPRDSTNRKQDDMGIEHFSISGVPLGLVTPEKAVSLYQGPESEAEAALSGVIHMANKGLAHITSGLNLSNTDFQHLEIASRGVRALVISHFYTPLGLLPPDIGVTEVKS